VPLLQAGSASGVGGALRARVFRVEDECATEATKTLAMGISNALVDLKMLPIWNISQLPEAAQEVLAVAGLILERLREEHASDVDP
jgi:hypothetical protein